MDWLFLMGAIVHYEGSHGFLALPTKKEGP